MDVAFIEFHDAELVSMGVDASQLSLTFSHVCLYELVAPAKYAAWSFTGGLWIQAPRDIHFRLAGPLPEDIMDLEIDGTYPDEKSAPKLLAGTSASAIRFTLADGSEGSCKCSLVRFEIGKKLSRQADWLGPL